MARADRDSPYNRSPSRQEEHPTVKPRKSIKSFSIKLEHARPRVMLLASCMVYLTTTLLAFQISVVSVSNLVWPEYQRVHDQLQAQSSALHKEQVVYARLNGVLSGQLSRNFMETYEDCLVRGLKKADRELIGLGFRYPDVREQVMDWTMENCGRLQYAPQVVNEEPTPQEAVLTYWASVSYRARKIAAEALGFVKQKLGWVWGRLFGPTEPEDASLRTESATTDDFATNDYVSERILPEVPFGFALDCNPDQPCRLFYPEELVTHYDKPSVSPEVLKHLEQRNTKLLAFGTTLDRIGTAITKVSCVVTYSKILFLFLSAVTFLSSISSETEPSLINPREEAMYLVKSMMLEHLSSAAIFTLDTYPHMLPDIRTAIIFGCFMTALGLNMALRFLLSSSQVETLSNLYSTTKDLCLLVLGREIPVEENTEVASTAGDDSKKEQSSRTKDKAPPEKRSPFTSYRSRPRIPSKPHHRLADPTTTVQEDIESLRKARHKNDTRHVATDSDSDSDADSDAFVNLAADLATGTDYLAEPDWSWIDR
ncbi:hypothetical protein ACJQWK_07624 [Exserohilum turcicum]|uniref:Uncharacterized protein n=1 Tax=Exserohilum turcicum (strain 28A) TaxID=671987 RepID=R0J0Y7_EXST2|nr:uncharacterized protein SETTUDRAFT_37073 [Exserohilum turcica Et28A]EOA90436.1 hypothetical protein SETTUDRAFT_37073 [Exserohilum turcica Et28A]